jgi:hypothetical protein
VRSTFNGKWRPCWNLLSRYEIVKSQEVCFLQIVCSPHCIVGYDSLGELTELTEKWTEIYGNHHSRYPGDMAFRAINDNEYESHKTSASLCAFIQIIRNPGLISVRFFSIHIPNRCSALCLWDSYEYLWDSVTWAEQTFGLLKLRIRSPTVRPTKLHVQKYYIEANVCV